jgi:hypothetical protein
MDPPSLWKFPGSETGADPEFFLEGPPKLKKIHLQGRIQELQLGGSKLFEAGGLGASLRPPVGPGWSPVGGPGGKAPEAPGF